MDVFSLRDRVIDEYASFAASFIQFRDDRIREHVDESLASGFLWPEPLIQLNPGFERAETVEQLVGEGILHPGCGRIFRLRQDGGRSESIRLHRHQAEAIRAAKKEKSYVLTTGTGSGKSLAYIIPIVDLVLRNPSPDRVKAIIVYPMNALANSQMGELEKFLGDAEPGDRVTFARYTGQESDEDRRRIIEDPPDILLTNYVMLELLLTRPFEKQLIHAARGLRFLVFDELHTYRGRQGADVAMLIRRTREALEAKRLQCVGTSATIAGSGERVEQRREVARVASLLFGTKVQADDVIGETLRRVTEERDFRDATELSALRSRVEDRAGPPSNYEDLVDDPLSSWIETTFGARSHPDDDDLVRAEPRSISGDEGAARELAELVGLSEELCTDAVEKHLLAGHRCPDPDTGDPVFAFRLHQFISRGDTVYASLEAESDRYITVNKQQYVPNDRSRVLLPLAFCRECGQEYYMVRKGRDDTSGLRRFIAREYSDHQDSDDGEAGFLYLCSEDPWPSDPEVILDRVPEDWLDTRGATRRVKSYYRDELPAPVRLAPSGTEAEEGVEAHWFPKFRFCLRCGVAYSARGVRSDFAKIGILGSGGRSSATTVLSLSSVQELEDQESLPARARKLLSFTDNRQDASLQAGHFNDFVDVVLLRSAIYRAAAAAGPEGIAHEDLTQRVFEALDLPVELYAADPDVRFKAREDTDRAFREMLGYRLYRDLKRGWRITCPNLEQTGLLEIRYRSLHELCASQEDWGDLHPALASAAAEDRTRVVKTLLDYMRRELCVKVDYLDSRYQERIRQQSAQWLSREWAIDENEPMDTAAILFPRSQRKDDWRGNVFLSPRGGFGQFLRRQSTLPHYEGDRLTLDDTQEMCEQLLEVLRRAGLTQIVHEATDEDEVPGYQLPAGAMRWVAGDGTESFHDPIRVPRQSEEGGTPNPYFVSLYRGSGDELRGIRSREHTAQVDYDERQRREEAFREGRLPILYCSPTMELGIDIAELNLVNLRNVPPTPANYAQRSGRAGRSGQPALVLTYCSKGSSHDQYFFKRPERMVAGAVTPPRIDLANEDLIRAHIQAVWLAEMGQSLHTSLSELLDLSSSDLPFRDGVDENLSSDGARRRAGERAEHILASLESELAGADWYSESWLEEVLAQVARRFDAAADRWRGLYQSAARQQRVQHEIASDPSRTPDERRRARRLRQDAESQLELLMDTRYVWQSDFYSYRYFASEGFLPGYNFPRLPLSAYIPGRRARSERDEFLSRPRFLAISEFGPRSFIYHEGSRYLVNQVILPADREEIRTSAAKQCTQCGYLHPVEDGDGPDLCERCEVRLPAPIQPMFRLQNVSTVRRAKINSDEEERVRMGYDLVTGIRFAERGGEPSFRTARVEADGAMVARLIYGDAARLWRINLGWARRKERDRLGFVLDLEQGYWARSQEVEEEDHEDPLSNRKERVIPFVEDHKNSLLFEFEEVPETEVVASLQAALKSAIQVEYELEENELAAEPLPDPDDRRLILFYEASEGGAGVLRMLVEDPSALARVAKQALSICHFDPETGEDLRRAPGATEDCEAACYDCLMTYTNQRDHALLDRQKIRDALLRLARSKVSVSSTPRSRSGQLKRLLRQAESDLEHHWLEFLEERDLRLPSRAQTFFEECRTRPDFFYDDALTAVYVDGPDHDDPDRKGRDRTQTDCMRNLGYTVLRFGHDDDWEEMVERYPSVFGSGT